MQYLLMNTRPNGQIDEWINKFVRLAHLGENRDETDLDIVSHSDCKRPTLPCDWNNVNNRVIKHNQSLSLTISWQVENVR